ncbi:MAG: UDP-N-acetylenolpyruvoylglucosamine reductase [Candidatus Hydrogenedentota bacterium]
METLPFEFAMENYPLAPLTLYQVGGPARLALLPRTLDEANDAYQWMVQQPERRIVLGGGSNVLIDDNGFDGIVFVTTKLDGIQPLGDDRYHVLAGVVLDRMVREVMLANNYDMVGGLTGIPGTVGGAIYMNAGTVNGSTCMLMESVDVATPEGLRTIPMDESLYSYRGQTFCPPGSLILGGTFRFTRAEKDQQAIYDHYIQRRKEKQPQGKCCGSVFKNPQGDHSGRLIEACGLKGTRLGGAQVSPLHANFIMNDDNATCADILALIDLCKRTVQKRFGVTLEEEVVYIH